MACSVRLWVFAYLSAAAALGGPISGCGVPSYRNTPATCDDGQQNGQESDTDCGGGTCQPCGLGKHCQTTSDCQSGVPCTQGTCQANHCESKLQDADETAVDCGGTQCPACGVGQACVLPRDCVSDVCSAGTCRAAGCGNQAKDPSETDVDCGGSCPPCTGGLSCTADGDCRSNLCINQVCATESCQDGIQSGTETDRDCGGTSCDACETGQRCLLGADCETSVCASGYCVEPKCTDGQLNGTETDQDCGGGQCPPCGTDAHCLGAADCESRVCSQGRCLPSACDDGVKNGTETAVDCGGSCTSSCQANQTCVHRCVTGSACNIKNDCESFVCTNGACVAAACPDGVRNGAETDVDCGGGGGCPLCGAGRGCQINEDCSTGRCVDGQCATAVCGDGVKNGTETDVDCGGGGCTACPVGGTCTCSDDCLSRVCGSGKTCLVPTCKDGVKNGTETDQDCGGGTCPACSEVGEGCSQGSDCATGSCVGSLCAAATCHDKVQNGNETAPDCGGGCSPCADGLACQLGSGCQSGVCAGTCQKATCKDVVKNGAETGTDCGGGECPTCPAGQDCKVGADCLSLFCSKATPNAPSGTCREPRCGDGFQNGNETDVDCGGSCAACPDLAHCGTATDCQSLHCVGGFCQAATCRDGIQNGGETAPDCGGGAHPNLEVCNPCSDGAGCKQGSDCVSRVCTGSGASLACQVANCHDGTQNGDETDQDCGGSCPGACGPGQKCALGKDCSSGVCDQRICQQPTCIDSVKNGSETAVDCGGSCVASHDKKCAEGQACGNGGDCASGVCLNSLCQQPTCADGVTNGGETGPDCGGNTLCARCPTGAGCLRDSDCDATSGLVCHSVNQTCTSYTCNDTIQNGDETGVNCGGAVCGPCADGVGCNLDRDCKSGICSGNPKVCQVPTCQDGLKNGKEGDTDCGADPNGVTCPKCAVNQTCSTGSQCDSGVCAGGKCAAPNCSDQTKNGGETDVDCGGPCVSLAPAQTCADARGCARDTDCTSTICGPNLKCTQPSCTDAHQNLAETDVDCGGGTCGQCGDKQRCKVDGDCLSSMCLGTGTLTCCGDTTGTLCAACAPRVCPAEWTACQNQTAGGGQTQCLNIYNCITEQKCASYTSCWSGGNGACSTVIGANGGQGGPGYAAFRAVMTCAGCEGY